MFDALIERYRDRDFAGTHLGRVDELGTNEANVWLLVPSADGIHSDVGIAEVSWTDSEFTVEDETFETIEEAFEAIDAAIDLVVAETV